MLLNQRVLAGLGNRNADESLWLARIDPRRSTASLSQDELSRLHTAIVEVLTEGLALRGTQRDLFGRKGQAQQGRYVFERTGRPCPRCATPVALEDWRAEYSLLPTVPAIMPMPFIGSSSSLRKDVYRLPRPT